MNAADIRDALNCGRTSCPCRRGRNTHCPTHDDSMPSLTVDDREGMVVWHCKKGCSQADVFEALKGRGLLDESRPSQPLAGRTERLVKEYAFGDPPVAYHGRFEGPNGKTFRWRRADGEWHEGLGFPEHELPLYGLTQLLARPDETVWFVEGEKAADACLDHGLLAVSLGGGASQQRFGNALDPLVGRDVVLWPDNDDAGRGLMSRISGYLEDARSVSPPAAKGGDAYDYFASGGTVEALVAQSRALEPFARVVDSDTVEVVYPLSGGHLMFTFTEFWAAARTLEASFKVEASYPGLTSIEYSGRLNFRSSSTRNTIRLEMEKVYETKEIPWAKVISNACSLAEEAWLGIDTSVDIMDVEPSEHRKWLADHFVPLNVVTCMFGMGGSAKSLVSLDFAMHCLFENTWMGKAISPINGFTVLDYEDHEDEWRMRVDQLCAAHGWEMQRGMFRYEPGRGIPVADHARLRERMAERGHELLIVDSAISAVGGKVLDEAAVTVCLNKLNDLGRAGVTTLLIAHVTKSEDSQYPFGSIFWHNLVRGSHYFEYFQADGSPSAELQIWNRKANRGRQKPTGVRLDFDTLVEDGPIRITPSSLAIDVRDETTSSNQRYDLMRWLVEDVEDCNAEEAAKFLSTSAQRARNLLNSDGFCKLPGTRPTRYSAIRGEVNVEANL